MFKEINVTKLEEEIVNRNDKFKEVDLTTAFKYCISDDDRKVKLVLKDQKQIGVKKGNNSPYNMQSNEACFEAWASIIYTHYLRKNGTVILEADFDIESDWHIYNKNPHFGRFLYRALRFSQQYEWFKLGDNLQDTVDKFKEDLNKRNFTNNIPTAEMSSERSGDEDKIEKYFGDTEEGREYLWDNLLELKGEKILYRQLPVGIFNNDKQGDQPEAKRVFTGSNAMIDLWAIYDDTFYAIELKKEEGNEQVGALTEFFFYSNIMYDLLVTSKNNSHFILNKGYPRKDNFRGYSELLKRAPNINQVRGLLLLENNAVHKLITDEVLEVLNGTKYNIDYDLIKYDYAKVKPCIVDKKANL